MKKLALAIAIATTPFAVQAETLNLQIEKPEFYGRINMSVQAATENDRTSTQMKSNASRVGIKGKGNLDHGLKAIYQLEYAVYPDAGSTDDKDKEFTVRDSFIGLQGGFGEIKAGALNTPFKKIENKIDLFNNLEGDLKNLISEDQDRKKNSVHYTTPKMSGLQLSTALIANKDEVAGNTTGADDGISIALAYQRDNWLVAYAHNDGVDGKDTDADRVTTQIKFGSVQLGALWEQSDQGAGSENAWLVSAAWQASQAITLKAQGGQSDIHEQGGQTASLGLDYALAKNAKTFVYFTSNRADDSSKDADYAGVGLEYIF